jgi:peptidoglycan/xylan/chitin deacetylase (PgdA/CDA1 family)
MSLRSQARAFVIHTARLVRADALAVKAQSRRAQAVVIVMHETPASFEAKFHEQLAWALQYFTITSLENLATFLSGVQKSEPAAKPLLLFTFDDGRESNYTVAAPLLESFGGRGLFFIVPRFAECASDERARAFYRSRINPGLKQEEEDAEDWKPMNPGQIAELASRGHAIGNHTLTHERLVGLSPEHLEREIGDSARKLESWTQKPVDAFAWTFGWDAIDARAWNVIRQYHRFCFSPCAGVVDGSSDPMLLWRREVELRYSAAELRFSYSGLVDLWWGTRRRRLREMLQAG